MAQMAPTFSSNYEPDETYVKFTCPECGFSDYTDGEPACNRCGFGTDSFESGVIPNEGVSCR